MAKQNFEKFINKEVKGAKKKEQIKQEKKQVKKEREAYFIEKKREQRALKKLQQEQQGATPYKSRKAGAGNSSGSTRPGKPVLKKKEEANSFEKPAYKPTGNKPSIYLKDNSSKDRNTGKAYTKKTETTREPKAIEKQRSKTVEPAKQEWSKPVTKPSAVQRPEKKATATGDLRTKINGPKKAPVEITGTKKTATPAKKATSPKATPQALTNKTFIEPATPVNKKAANKIAVEKPGASKEAAMPLNKYIAHGGICSRRDAGELVKSGKVSVNGTVVTEPGTKISEGDTVIADGKKVTPRQALVYILLNKPKDYITTADDPQGRKTVLDIVSNATTERIFPVGRLDRNTSGVLLLTNDGDLAQQLTHPSYEVRKIYEAKLDKPLTKADFTKLLDGVELEDGKVHADSVAYADSKDKSIIGIEIHSGRNRVVRRMFEHLGYDVKGLDRVMFANLTKKNVERGNYRFLTEKEVRLLKFFKSAKR